MSDVKNFVPVWFLFGLSGSGKSFAGEVIARALGWSVYHADDDITPAMQQALAASRPFTDAMRDDYFILLADRIRARQAQAGPDQPLIVTQGAYKKRNRDFLQAQVPGLALIWIDAPDSLIAQRLRLRSAGITEASAAALKQDFEYPSAGSMTIVNDSGAERILAQFEVCREQWLTRSPQVI
ncbi:AAA family ATPase [Pseudohongiella sp.]|uniref:Gluconokinase n=1 Tax=marine sediment metagenome TaxID=412755 RepID=A0A0F9Y4S8_9ZZZZ|nr:AAA family ATPase [Pseudohongiella sp.]HDZ10135.1 hypothetical protein [Pseudohongiella sp.]HEA64334.1 hypothetical protein [Pseudohongiella sp.]